MTTTQTSFSAFAATQTDPGNFAVSDQSGQRGCFPSCLFPQPDFVRPISFLTGCQFSLDVRTCDGFFSADVIGCLDAPLFVASGGVNSLVIGNRNVAFQMAYRF